MRRGKGRDQDNAVLEVTFPQGRREKKRLSNILIKAVKIVRKSNEDIKAKDLELKHFSISPEPLSESQICPLFRRHSQEHFMFATCKGKISRKILANILENGIDVRYEEKPGVVERYKFFGHSASQLRSRVCLMYNSSYESAEKIISKFGDFSKLKTVAKRAARIGLLLSTAEETVKLREDDIHRIGDIERNGHTFTDGCGYISPALAEKVTQRLGITEKYSHQEYHCPSVFQVRLLGCKGVLAVKPSLEGGLEIRKSMEKFSWLLPEPFPLGVVDRGYSKPYDIGSLNKQFIMLLSALGIPDEVFLEKQKAYFLDIASLTVNKETAFTYLCAFGDIAFAEQLLQADHIEGDVLKKIKKIQQQVYQASAGKISAAQRLKIPLEMSRNVFGVSDPSENDLEYGTCFFQPTIRGQRKTVVGKVVVMKNPCYSPGDVRILTCVDAPCCHHLVDCIVFPTKGERPHPDEIAGSDLDGDKFFVCWDPDLIPCKNEKPVTYPAAKVPEKDRIEQKDMIDYFARYSNAAVGRIDSLFIKWADRKGVASVECQELSALFSRAVDSAKTGETIMIPKHLQLNDEPIFYHEKFVWHKMASKVKLFLEDMVNGVEIKGQVQLTEETVKSILLNETINVSEYQLFRFLYKWASHEEIPAQQLCSIAEECIDFAEFSSEQLRRTQIDCPKLNPDVLFNPFARSQILAEYDLKNLASDHRYSLVFKANAEDLSWAVLNNVLTSAVAKILIFKFLLGGMEWVCVLNLPQKLMSRDTVEVNDAEDVLPRVYLSIHQDKPDSKRLLLKDGYSISLSDQRLQIYQGSKHRTFISFNINDANDLSVVSIALDRFDPRLAAKYGVRLRKEAFVSFEVYCLDPMGAQISKIYRTVPPTAKEQTSSDSRGAIDETFNFMDEEFPFLGEEYGGINSEVEKELRELYDLLKSGDLTVVNFKKVLQQLKGMKGYPMERHEWACMLESLLDECGIPLGSQDDYLSLLVYLLDGLKKCSIRIMIGRRINTTLLERIRRVLERMRTNDVFLSVENIFHLFETLLFAHDWVTSSFVVTLLKEDHFPIAQGTFLPHENVKAYFIHWTSLLYLEILEEIKELEEQDMNMRENRTILQGMIISETKDNDETPTSECTLFVQEGDATFNQGDFLALSPTNASHVFRERKYIVDVKSVAGPKHIVNLKEIGRVFQARGGKAQE